MAGLPETIERIKPSVVGIGTYNKLSAPRATLNGTGFAIRGNLIATNAHVISSRFLKKNSQFAVFIGSGRLAEVRLAKVVMRDEQHDLALLTVPGKTLPAMTLSSHRVREGEEYNFTGFPIGSILGLYPVTHRGMVSSISPVAIPANNANELTAMQLKQLKQKPYSVYQLDATAYPGNSGSPVYNPDTGDVVAVINKVLVKKGRESALTNPSAITYAIPIKHLKKLLANYQQDD